jgi:hypothetical protein
MKQYASIAYILPPYDAGDKYESLLNYDFYQNFFLTILETVTEVYGDKTPPILLCDMYKEVADVNPNDDNSLKNIIDGAMNALDDIKKTIEPTDFTQLIQGAGVLAVPKAKAEAVKNAVKSFGNLFGRNLARVDDRADTEIAVVNQSRAKIGRALEAKNE